LYLIGGISRVSQKISDELFLSLFEEYKKYSENNNYKLIYEHEKDIKKYSVWIKKCLNEREFFEFVSNSKKEEIKKYLLKNDENTNDTNDFLLDIFQRFLSLYLKCKLLIPPIEIKYFDDYCKFNFCYIPELKSNGKILKKGNARFTYFEGQGQTYEKMEKFMIK